MRLLLHDRVSPAATEFDRHYRTPTYPHCGNHQILYAGGMSNLFIPISLILIGLALAIPDRTITVVAGVLAIVAGVLALVR